MEIRNKKKTYIVIGAAVLILATAIGTPHVVRAIQRKSDTVYICTGRYSKAYHCTAHCKGLDNCSADVITVSKEQARKQYRHPCGYCYGKKWEKK